MNKISVENVRNMHFGSFKESATLKASSDEEEKIYRTLIGVAISEALHFFPDEEKSQLFIKLR